MSEMEQPPISTDILWHVSTMEEKYICQSCFPERVQGRVEGGWQERCAAISPWMKGANMRQHECSVLNCSPPPLWPKHDALQQPSHAGPPSFSSASEGKRIFKILKKITLVWYQSTSSAGSGSCLWQWPTADAQEKNPKNHSFITSYLFQHSCATDSKAQGRQSQQAHNLAPTVKCSILIQSKTSELSEILSSSRHKMKGRYIYQLCFWLNAHFS